MSLSPNIPAYMLVLLDDKFQLKVVLWIFKKINGYIIITNDSKNSDVIDQNLPNLEKVITCVKNLACKYDTKYYMPYANIYKVSYALKNVAMFMSDFTFEPFS